MSEATLNLSPSAALAALFSHTGRGLLWVTVKAARAPLTTIVCGLSAFFMISATSNALYMQPVDHPSPFFTDRALVTSALPPVAAPQVTVTPSQQRRFVQPVAVNKSVAPTPATPRAIAEIGHDDIKAMQETLRSIGLYQGEADGFYGPKTATAIRAYEAQNGLPEVGALTPQILHTITNQAHAAAPINTVRGVAAPRVATSENVIQQISNSVTGSGETLAVAANQIRQQIQTQIESVEPDRLTQIVQRVANASPVQTQMPARIAAPAGPSDKAYVKKVQRGLSSLGFLHGEIDGVAGEGTARAIRNFEVYYNYKVTGAITPELLDLLSGAGAEV